MTYIDRRKLLKLSAASAVAASTGGLAAILATRSPPAYAQAATVHWLRWADFVPASDQLLKNQIAPECAKALGIKLIVETINANDLQARATAAIQSGTGPDIICAFNNWPQLYIDSLVDVSDVAPEIGKSQGGYLLAKAQQVSSRVFNRLLKDSGGADINSAQGRILFALWNHGRMSISALAKRVLGVSLAVPH